MTTTDKQEMYIESIYVSKIGYGRPKEGEPLKYKGKIKFSDGEQEFTFVLDDDTTRIVTMCCMDRIKDTADSFTEKIKNLIKPPTKKP